MVLLLDVVSQIWFEPEEDDGLVFIEYELHSRISGNSSNKHPIRSKGIHPSIN